MTIVNPTERILELRYLRIPQDGCELRVTGLLWRSRSATRRAPSNPTFTGRYVLQPEIFGPLAAQKRRADGEIELTDAMTELASR
jgi:UTP--glucose-1-phosphate uridylyltransferase